MIGVGALLVAEGFWMGLWALSGIGVLLGFKGLRGYADPDRLLDSPRELAHRMMASRRADFADLQDRRSIAEKIASLQDDLDRLEGRGRTGITRQRLQTWVAAAVTALAGMLLVIDQAMDGDGTAALFTVILMGLILVLFVRADTTINRRKQAADAVRSQITSLRNRLSTLEASSSDSHDP